MTGTDKDILAIGLMSGTSLDGIDAALVETDGQTRIRTGDFLTVPYSDGFRARLRATLGTRGDTALAHDVASELATLHAQAVAKLLARAGLAASDAGLIGFHGQTILHDPANRFTRQLGDGALLARLTGIPVVNDFRRADVAAGGQGAPLVPLFHKALAAPLERPLAILNIGGVANVTFLGSGDPIAFDTGPGNALIDDLFLARTGMAFDEGGAVAVSGNADRQILACLMDHPYFSAPVPKSLDREAFDSSPVAGLSLADAAATLAAFTAAAVAAAQTFLPAASRRWLVCGGGRHNDAIMSALRRALGVAVDPVETVGWNGDALEAQAFAYLAVRALKGLPLTLPTTTGVPMPLTGGVLHAA